MSAVLEPVLELRPMTESDLPAVMAVENAIYAFPWTLGNFRDSLAAGYNCWIYARDGGLVGYAVLMTGADEAHLLNLSIASNCQGQGYGSLLLLRLCDLARRGSARRIFLEVRPSNAAGMRLYARHGFRMVGLRREYYPAPAGREDALVFSKQL